MANVWLAGYFNLDHTQSDTDKLSIFSLQINVSSTMIFSPCEVGLLLTIVSLINLESTKNQMK